MFAAQVFSTSSWSYARWREHTCWLTWHAGYSKRKAKQKKNYKQYMWTAMGNNALGAVCLIEIYWVRIAIVVVVFAVAVIVVGEGVCAERAENVMITGYCPFDFIISDLPIRRAATSLHLCLSPSFASCCLLLSNIYHYHLLCALCNCFVGAIRDINAILIKQSKCLLLIPFPLVEEVLTSYPLGSGHYSSVLIENVYKGSRRRGKPHLL